MSDMTANIDDELLPRVRDFSLRHHTAMLVVLFTDVEGSTELAERIGEAASQDLRRELETKLKGIVDRDDAGECLKTIGDSLTVHLLRAVGGCPASCRNAASSAE